MSKESLVWIFVIVVSVVILTWLAVRAIRWAKKGTKAGSMLAAAAFPFPDQPPPEEQVEQQSRIKKSAESGDPKRPAR
jgi:hypothetical protein